MSGNEQVAIEYYGLGLGETDLVSSPEFRELLRSNGLVLVKGDSPDEWTPVEGEAVEDGYLYVHDPVSDSSLAVLYDDESDSYLEHPAFAEILQLMDEYSKEKFESRLFPFYSDEEEDEDLNHEVDQSHPFYTKKFDFKTGAYIR